jgi:hypothetical protein
MRRIRALRLKALNNRIERAPQDPRSSDPNRAEKGSGRRWGREGLGSGRRRGGSRSCAWELAASLEAGGGRLMRCKINFLLRGLRGDVDLFQGREWVLDSYIEMRARET